tara:strand:+ start:4351 stop:4734 length:384 start_codon:yes stop_codon:yes gene_type:complete
MSRINKIALRKAKAKLKKQAKDGSEHAESILSKRNQRKANRLEAFHESDYEIKKTNVAFNFSSGDLVSIKPRKAGRYGVAPEHLYLVIGMIDGRGSNYKTETNGWLEITGVNGVLSVRSADVKKITD